MKRLIIAGSRDFDNAELLNSKCLILTSGLWQSDRLVVLCGMAQGADKLAYHWAIDHGFKVLEYPADWTKHGKSAGPIRNEEMAKNADMLVAFWDGKSPGTKDMILRAIEHGLEIHVFRY